MWKSRSITTLLLSSSSSSTASTHSSQSILKSILPNSSSSSSSSSSSLTLTSTIRCFSLKTLTNNHGKLLLSTSSKPTTLNSNFNSRNPSICFIVRSISSVYSSPNLFEFNDDPVTTTTSEEDVVCKTTIPVRAYFISTGLDLKGLVDQNKANFIPPTSRMTNYVVLRFGNPKCDINGLEGSLNVSDCSYMVVFQYGSIVLFNIRDNEVDGYLKIAQKHASGLLPEMRKDEYEVREKPTLHTWMQGGLDYIVLQHLDTDGIRTIGSVLGQSIALDYYVRQVDGMVAEFTDINRGMEKTGTFTMKRKKLFQLVGKANSNLADVILKLGLFERSDIAWKDAKYAQIWEYLRDEFELTQRFASLDFKLKFVEHNIRFLQEILQNRKSDFLEWLIIILISVEIMISLYDIVHRSSIISL